MLEIKAFVRVNMVDKVVQALETAGITNITVSTFARSGPGARREPGR